MKREELLNSPVYWTAMIQNRLFQILHEYMKKNDLKKKDIAEKLGFSKGYISQVMNGDFDHKLSKLVELSLAADKIPFIEFKDKKQFIEDDLNDVVAHKKESRPIQYNVIISNNDPLTVDRNTIKSIEKFYDVSETGKFIGVTEFENIED